MKLYLKQKFFSWNDKFTVYDENGNDKYYVEGEFFSFGKKLHVYDLSGKEIAFIHQEVFSFMPKYYINIGGRDVADVKKHFTFFKHEYSVNGFGWSVEGDFFDHEYTITDKNRMVASVYREWFTLGDAYVIDISDGVKDEAALAVALVVDAVISAERDD